jgi:condensin-2 complex subunit G2
LVPVCVAVMRPQIATGSSTVSRLYGEILVKAWREVSAPSNIPDHDSEAHLAAFEDVIRDVVHDCIHSADPNCFRGYRTVLSAFVESKKYKGIDAMLLRVYGPILFRSLRSANALVRSQAVMLFFDAFPLQDPDSSSNGGGNCVIHKQFSLLSSLLKDCDHRVRAASASGVCRVLREYWEIMPSQSTRQILSYLVGTLAFDCSTPCVRRAVILGLCDVLEQPLAHGTLKGLLPLLSKCLYDKSSSVRASYVTLLQKVSIYYSSSCSWIRSSKILNDHSTSIMLLL